MSGCIEILQANCTETRSGELDGFWPPIVPVSRVATLLAYYVWRPLIWKHLHR